VQIQTNLVGVIGQVQRLKAHVPMAAGRALSPEIWEPVAYGTADRTMRALAKPDETRHIPLFLATLMATVFPPEGLSLFMAKPGPEAGPRLRAPEQILGPDHAGTAGEWGPYMFSMPIPEFKELIQKWVETPQEDGGKRRDERDAEKSTEEIASYVADVLLSPNKQAQEARKRLLPHILEWLKKNGEAAGLDPKERGAGHAGEPGYFSLLNADELDPATVDLWLRAVLEAWKVMVLAGFDQRFRQELVKMREEL